MQQPCVNSSSAVRAMLECQCRGLKPRRFMCNLPLIVTLGVTLLSSGESGSLKINTLVAFAAFLGCGPITVANDVIVILLLL